MIEIFPFRNGVFILMCSFLHISLLSGIDMSVKTALFKTENQAYLEVYLYIVGSSVKYDTLPDNALQAKVELTLIIEKEGAIFAFDKFTMFSPADFEPKDFMELRRIALPNGSYSLNVEANDLTDPSNIFTAILPISVDFDTKPVQLSDIQLSSNVKKSDTESRFIKNGYFIEPAAFDFFPADVATLSAYVEVYQNSVIPDQEHYLRYAVYQIINDQNQSLKLQKFKKTDSKPIQSFILQLPLEELSSGNYLFTIELRNQQKELVDIKTNIFQRSNPFKDFIQFQPDESIYGKAFVHSIGQEELIYILKALTPLVKGNQSILLSQTMLSKEYSAQKYFVWSYFSEISPSDPFSAYKQFREVARAIDITFRSNVGFGFETDRGRIYMKYGRPTEIIKSEDEPSAPPYEIWFYDQITEVRQVNVKFIFFNPSLGINDMVLLHSNCKNERYNPRWEVELYKNAPNEQEGNSTISTRMMENYRRDARKIWDEL